MILKFIYYFEKKDKNIYLKFFEILLGVSYPENKPPDEAKMELIIHPLLPNPAVNPLSPKSEVNPFSPKSEVNPTSPGPPLQGSCRFSCFQAFWNIRKLINLEWNAVVDFKSENDGYLINSWSDKALKSTLVSRTLSRKMIKSTLYTSLYIYCTRKYNFKYFSWTFENEKTI